ncbi:MAG: altronate dehydratase [Armatimonadetes bacterium]|nr:altronate dehydratase [Armatimonadota bacterium]MDE2207455.1 altronate dehydratase [Armatimonadota bacterium]
MTAGRELEFASAVLLLKSGDSVAVARRALNTGDVLVGDGITVTVRAEVPAGHKVAVRAARTGDEIRKYGQMIGFASQEIATGDWVHLHNLSFARVEEAARAEPDYAWGADADRCRISPAVEQRTFPGYLRPDGSVGTRNYVAVISSVNCSANSAIGIAERFRGAALLDFPGVDGVVPFTHKSGCGQHLGGADYKQLQRTLAGIATHPNVSGYLFTGLGCEDNQISALASNTGLIRAGELGTHPQRPRGIVIQEEGGVARTIARGAEALEPLLRQAAAAVRTTQPAAALVIGTNCGGSDGASGITANPALGHAGDLFVAQGSGWVLAETSETYGAEHLLTRRAISPAVGRKLVELMRWWEWYTGTFGATLDANPAPGNKEGGLTTIYEKSLGAVAKAGSSPLMEVYGYGERILQHGLTFMDTPGHDPVSVTGLAAGGCSLIAFTTGRGSCLGFKPCPVLKISTTTSLYERMPNDMDLDAGVIFNGVAVEDVGQQIFERLLEVAGGARTLSEAQGFGEAEFAPWLLGPVM